MASAHRKRFTWTALAVGAMVLTASSAHDVGHEAVSSRPNIVFLLTDDQRFDELGRMPIVQRELIGKGVLFRSAFVSNPLCCPSRATILTGTYSHTTGVYANDDANGGGFAQFRDSTTIATVLHSMGYSTALIGKYLNGYTGHVHYVPPGWDHWLALTNTNFFGFKASRNGHLAEFPSGLYQTDALGQDAVAYIHSVPTGQPLFLYWSPHAPHYPATPPPMDSNRFSRMKPLRPPSFNEADVSDKPQYVRNKAKFSQAAAAKVDEFRRDQYRSLLSVDEWIGAILKALSDTRRLNNSLIVFMSDNGLLLGEHRFWKWKTMPYEESIRVPLIVRWDAAGWNVPRTDQQDLVANVDLAETWAKAAGSTMPGNEGLSLLPILASREVTSWRTALLLEQATDPIVPSYCGVRENRYVYVQYATGEEELYDLTTDPYELRNVASDTGSAATLVRMRAEDHQLCRPVPPGFAWTH
jgi:N-acetylglucosamine-6-sulfatase